MKTKLKWQAATVGCYWMANRETRSGMLKFSISTFITMRDGRPVLTFPDSGYQLYCNREDIGRFKTLKAAQRAAERFPISPHESATPNTLQCQMDDDCKNPVTHIGHKGYIYCKTCIVHRKGYEQCRRLRAWEIKLLLAGEPVPSYKPIPKPKEARYETQISALSR